MKTNIIKINFIIQIAFLLLSGALFGLYLLVRPNFNYLYISVLFIWLHNILYGYSHFKKGLLFIFFHFTFFVFLMTKPLYAILRGENWANTIYVKFSPNADIEKMLISMGLSLLFLWMGSMQIINLNKSNHHKSGCYRKMNNHVMQQISCVAFMISGIFTLIVGIEKIVFIQTHTYLDYYSKFQTQLPYAVRVIATFSQYSFCLFLASLPNKKQAFLPCCIFILLALPNLIVGSRGQICLNILMVFFYYLLRDSWEDEKKWFGKVEHAIVYSATPFAVIFLGAYASIRANGRVQLTSLVSGFLNFFDQQGVTFQYMCAGMGSIDKLPPHQNYTFGSIIDYFMYGSIGRFLNGVSPLGNTNSIERAFSGNSYAHHISYILLGNRYLNGEGSGSCYINEIFADFSYIGIIAFSFLLGILLILLIRLSKKSFWCTAILLLSFNSIIYMPRAEFSGIVSYIMKMQFWAIVGTCYFCVYILSRKYIYKKWLYNLE